MVASNSASLWARRKREDHGRIIADLDPQRGRRVLERVGHGMANEFGTGPAIGARPAPRPCRSTARAAAIDVGPRVIGRVLHARSDVTGLDDDDADTEVPELVVQDLRQRLERVLRRRVDPFQRRADAPLYRAHVDQHPTTAPAPPLWPTAWAIRRGPRVLTSRTRAKSSSG